jgi:hypothetical protein
MDSKQMIAILTIVTIIIFGFISIGACLYAIPICWYIPVSSTLP